MASSSSQELQSNRLTFPQALCFLGVYLAYANGVSYYRDDRAAYDLTNRTIEDWEPRIGKTKYFCGEGFKGNAEEIMDDPAWENLCRHLSSKFRGRFKRYDIYDQLAYLLDGLERISQCSAGIQNVNYFPKPKPKSEVFNTEINFLLVGQSLGIYVSPPPGAIIDFRVEYEANFQINYEGLAGVLNRCSPFLGSRIGSWMVEAYIDDLWMVLGTTRKSTVRERTDLVANLQRPTLKRPSHDDLRDHGCKKQK